MNPPEAGIHSFIVKIWLDEECPETGKTGWHGSITHVGDGKRHPIQYLDEIPAFIIFYLEDQCFFIDSRRPVQRWQYWWRRWKLHGSMQARKAQDE